MIDRVRLDHAAIKRWEGSADAQKILASLGEQIAEDASAAAPRATGALADSIGYEVGEDQEGGFVHVSWDRDHFYGSFVELGTSHMPARPFLRPAAEKRRTL